MNGLERPSVTVHRIDVSAVRPNAPVVSEEALFRGYSGGSVLVTLPCVCGGDVTADPYAPARGVAAHQFTGRHKAWREAHDL